MANTRVELHNSKGQQLRANLSLPIDQEAYAFAIFAHCFTCSSSLLAVRQISRALNMEGIGVLRFDFTGLGGSEGDFSATNFTTNITDLLSAADWLSENYQAPSLLVGHSLGGAAVICAAQQLPSVAAVATLGAPFDPAHVEDLLGEEGRQEILAKGEADINIGGRPFKIQKQFLDDLGRYSAKEHIAHLGKALLVMHSPQDSTVGIDEAAKIYHAARHPKSFVSLDGADHLLTQKSDALYAGKVIAGWSTRYLQPPPDSPLKSSHSVAVRLGAHGFTTEVMVRQHQLTADEPESVGGNDFGPSPYELVSAGLGACTAMTMHMYARRKKWPLEEVIVHIDHRKDYATDMVDIENGQAKIDHFHRQIDIRGELDEEQRQRLLEIADRCPVHRTLHSPVEIRTTLG